jgi:hypothetical protein
MNEQEGVHWAKDQSILLLRQSVDCCTVIPVEPAMVQWNIYRRKVIFASAISSLEEVLEYGISLEKGRVFADTWDLGLISICDKCLDIRTGRMIEMNLSREK